MSRSENTLPWRLWAAYGLEYHRPVKRYRFAHHGSAIADDVRRASRRQRRHARAALRRGIEPEPYRPRHNVHWEAL